jgi:sulfotransferase famil protein
MLPLSQINALRANPQSRIVYLNNAKVGCTTVKATLWKALAPDTMTDDTDAHAIEGSPFTNELADLDWLAGAHIFSFVRNPHARIVSAYLNKIKHREKDTWAAFTHRHGIDPETWLSFPAFIEILHAAPPETLNEHFRPQYLNLMYPLIRPNFLGTLEHMDTQLPEVLRRLTGVRMQQPERRAGHGTDARARVVEHFADPATHQRFLDIFERDFTHFGYIPDPARPAPASAHAEYGDHPHPALAALAEYARTDPHKQRWGLIEAIEAACPDRNDPAIANWLLNARLENAQRRADGGMDLMQRNLDAVLSGPDYLRRTAASIAASRGDWATCVRIAARAAPDSIDS